MKMTPEQFAQAILESFTEVYGNCYTGTLFLYKLPTEGFDVGIAFNHREVAIHIAAELPEEKFIKYFKKELKRRLLSDIQFSKVVLDNKPLYNKPDGSEPYLDTEVLIHPSMSIEYVK